MRRLSIAGLMALVAVFALDWIVVRAGLDASGRVARDSLELWYSTVPDRRYLPHDQPVYADPSPFLSSDGIATGLGLLALVGTPMASLLGIGAALILRSRVLHGRCSPF